MWTLSQMRERVKDRLGDESDVFWSSQNLTEYINDAQKLIATITKGLVHGIGSEVGINQPALVLLPNALHTAPAQAIIDDGRILPIVSMEVASQINPNWRMQRAKTPQWGVWDFSSRRVHFTPVPRQPVFVTVRVVVLPDEVSDSSDSLFNGQSTMDRYLSPMINLVASYAMMKERYDNDAERYYQFFAQELAQIGVDPHDIPTFHQVRQQVTPNE